MKSNGDFSIGSNVWPGTSKLIEEMGELHQVLGKLIGSHGETAHFDGTDLRQKMVEEIGDLRAALSLFQDLNLTEAENEQVKERIMLKITRFAKWHVDSMHQDNMHQVSKRNE